MELNYDNSLINEIEIEELKTLVTTCLEQYGTQEKFDEAKKVASVMNGMLIKNKLLVPASRASWIDILMSAVYLHNLFYDPADWTTLFKARQMLAPIGANQEVNEAALDILFTLIECQLGEDTPVTKCKPVPNSPQEQFAWAVWFVKEYRQ